MLCIYHRKDNEKGETWEMGQRYWKEQRSSLCRIISVLLREMGIEYFKQLTGVSPFIPRPVG